MHISQIIAHKHLDTQVKYFIILPSWKLKLSLWLYSSYRVSELVYSVEWPLAFLRLVHCLCDVSILIQTWLGAVSVHIVLGGTLGPFFISQNSYSKFSWSVLIFVIASILTLIDGLHCVGISHTFPMMYWDLWCGKVALMLFLVQELKHQHLDFFSLCFFFSFAASYCETINTLIRVRPVRRVMLRLASSANQRETPPSIYMVG